MEEFTYRRGEFVCLLEEHDVSGVNLGIAAVRDRRVEDAAVLDGDGGVPRPGPRGDSMVLFLILGEMLNEKKGLGAAAPMVLSLVPMAAICLWIVGSRRLTHERRIPEPLVTRQGGETG
ncbi:hypothetical protein AB0E81_35695 [Streptomyces sp. NPDC033538]|uniref:hypothetical protein n=1 Tax=Streptomyces sp. NPDC033538 TaxID=3155367 RepID=UPI00340C8A44